MNRTIKIITLVFLFLMSIGVVIAISIPLPLYGTVEGGSGETVLLEHERTGETMITLVSPGGEYLYDLSNLENNVRSGDVFSIRLQGCESTGCATSVAYEGQDETRAPTLTIEGVRTLPEEETSQDPTECDCAGVLEAEGNDGWLKIGAGLVLGLIAGLVGFMGGGLKVYKSRLGSVKILHRHRGIRDYHDPDVQHRNPAYRHRRWSDDPLGCAKDVKKIEEEGGLE